MLRQLNLRYRQTWRSRPLVRYPQFPAWGLRRKEFIDEVYRRGWVFIHIPKTAGTSIKHALDLGKHFSHAMMVDYLAVDREAVERCCRFTFVRHPLDRLHSAYKHLGRGDNVNAYFKMLVTDHYPSFEAFVMDWLTEARARSWIHLVPQWEFMVDEQGAPACDFVGHFESLAEDYRTLCQKLGRRHQLLPHEKKSGSSGDSFLQAYTPDMARKARQIYARDFALFPEYSAP